MAKKTLKNRLIQGLSWIIVISIFLYILASIAPEDETTQLNLLEKIAYSLNLLKNSLEHASIAGIFAVTFFYFLYLFFWEVTGTRWVINRFNCPMSVSEMIPARAVTFLLAIFNYQAGQLALPLYLKRMHQVPLQEGMGSIFFFAAVDICIVLIMGTLGSLFINDATLSHQILMVGVLGIIAFILNGLFWRIERFSNWVIHLFQKIPLLKKLDTKRSIFYTFQKANLKDYLLAFFFRLPIHAGILLGLFFLIQCFGEYVAFPIFLIYMPIIMIIGTIPIINVGSMGATQASVVYFFKDYASEANLFAVALIWAFAVNFFKVIIGAIFLNKYSPKLFRSDGPITNAS